VRYEGYEEGIAADGRELHIATLTLFQNEQPIATIQPREDDFGEMVMMIAGAHSTLSNDFYVLLDAWDTERGLAAFVFYINPLVNFVWWGGIVLIIGTFISAWPKQIVPSSLRQPRSLPVTEGVPAT
jgi:cytochrome c-type biogenesis protein CcmF